MKHKTISKTKIIATVGPASNNYNTLEKLFLAGVNTFRLNFSHGSHEDHLKVIQTITKINTTHNAHIAILADLQGPKLRIGDIENGSIELKTGATIKVTTKKVLGNKEKVSVIYKKLISDVGIDEEIIVDDGKIELVVIEKNDKDTITCKVRFGGTLSSNKGFNLPTTKVSVPSLTKKDKKDLAFILTQPIDWLALSFVRSAQDIIYLKQILKNKKSLIKVIAKIEKPEAIQNLEAIINATDAVMIARGDLAVEVPMEKLPIIQKEIVKNCITKGRPVIMATQVMESMMEMPRPTRAEITDVANGVFDGVDAIMLSGETAVGKNPINVIKIIKKIILQTEQQNEIYYKKLLPDQKSTTFLSDAICYNACNIAKEVEAKAINGMTYSGYTAFMLASYRPKSNIYIFTSNEILLKQLGMVWGVKAFFYDKFVTTDETISDVINILKQNKKIKQGDVIINTASMPIKGRGRTNMIKISVAK
ncbi:MAG: pyruvate kinase [Chitinophagales bacterium]|nr:pyruvate kinase [Chitinophagales bacterium]